MRTRAIIVIVAVFGIAVATAGAGNPPRNERADGIVLRYYASSGYRFQPLLSFGKLNALVSAHNAPAARRLATALRSRAPPSSSATLRMRRPRTRRSAGCGRRCSCRWPAARGSASAASRTR